MNYKDRIKKQGTVIALIVICLTIATIGASYALFFHVETNSANQLVQAGNLVVEYGSGSSAITATEIMPMSDEDALASDTMTGTINIENKGSLPAFYSVKLGDDVQEFNKRENKKETDALISHEYLKIAVYLNEELIMEPTKLSDISYSSDDNTMHALFTDYLDIASTGNNTANIILKVWLVEDAPETVIGQFVYLKMDVTSEVDERLKEETNQLTFISDGSNLKDYRIYGNSVQNTDSKNLWNYKNSFTGTTRTHNGITYTKQDGGILVNGTATSQSLTSTYEMISDLEVGKTYTLSIADKSQTVIHPVIHYVENGTTYYKRTFTYTKDVTSVLIYFYLSTGETANNLFVQMQLEEGATATEYVPYVGKNPAPDNPIEIESVGERTKNLLDSSLWEEELTLQGVTIQYLKNEDCFVLNGTATALSAYALKNINLEVDTTKQYSLYLKYVSGSIDKSKTTDTNYAMFALGKSDTKTTTNSWDTTNWLIASLPTENTTTKSSTIDMQYLNQVWFYISPQVEFINYKVKLQLEEGSSATDYEPYGYKIPVTTSGINLFDKSQSYAYSTGSISSTETDTGLIVENGKDGAAHVFNLYHIAPVEDLNNQTIYMKSDVKLGGATSSMLVLGYSDSDGQNRIIKSIVSITSDGSYKIKMDVDAETYAGKYVSVWLYSNANSDVLSVKGTTIEFSNIMASVEDKPYEPYFESTTTNIYIDEPLRKVGDYVDYIDFSNGKLYRTVGAHTFTGNESVIAQGSKPNFAVVLPTPGITTVAPIGNYYIGNTSWWSNITSGQITLNTSGGQTLGISNSNYMLSADFKNYLSDFLFSSTIFALSMLKYLLVEIYKK